MQISVIIPVYNAEKFLRRSVESALNQKEVEEVILIEDGSLDNSWIICEELKNKHSKIKLSKHPRSVNKGAGASRNLGLVNASFEYIAFLDADDFYMPNRFENTKKIFDENPNIDGVFEMVGAKFYNDLAKNQHILRLQKAENPVENGVNTMLRVKDKDDVFKSLLLLKKGWIHLAGLTIKKELLIKTGYFNEFLRIAQDSEFILRCAFHGVLKGGGLDNIVSVRGVHQNNRILNVSQYNNFKNNSFLINEIFRYYIDKPVSDKVKAYILLRKIESYSFYFHSKGVTRKIIKFIYLILYLLRYPSLLINLFSIFKK